MTTLASESGPESPPAWRRWLTYVTIALMPLSINLERLSGPRKKPFSLSPFDVLLPLLALLMVSDILVRRPWPRFRAPHVAAILWALVAVASVAWLDNMAELTHGWFLAVANPLFVVVLGTWTFSNVAADPREYRRLALILGASFGVCVLFAFYQYIGPVGVAFNPATPDAPLGGVTNMRLGGWYDNRMQFGAQAAMLVPAAAAFAAWDDDPIMKVVSALLAALALTVTMAAGGFLGAIAGVLAVAGACVALRRPLSGLLVFGALGVFLFAVFPNLPQKRDNASVLLRGVALYARPNPAKEEKISTPRLRRYQAALDFLGSHADASNEQSRPNWILGGSAGRFTARINEYYDSAYYPKPGGATNDETLFDIGQDERDGYGLLEKTAVELGVVGLLAVLAFFGVWLASAGAALGARAANVRLLALAALGACVGAAVSSVLLFPTQRSGSGGTFAFYFAVALWAHLAARRETNTP
jgi:hypothetical protein